MNTRRLVTYIAVAATALTGGCAQLGPSIESSERDRGIALAEGPNRTNLLRSLKNNQRYGLIRYGDVEILYRDLSQAFAAAAPAAKSPASNPSPASAPPDAGSAKLVASPSATTIDDEVGDEIGEPLRTIAVEETAHEMPTAVPIAFAWPNDAQTSPNGQELSPPVAFVDGCHGGDDYGPAADEVWLAGRNDHEWTIQVISARDASEPCIGAYLDELGESARRFSVYFQNEIWNIGLVGAYPTLAAASAAAELLPDAWVRRIGDVRARRCQSANYMPSPLKERVERWCIKPDTVADETLWTTTSVPATHEAFSITNASIHVEDKPTSE